MSIPLTLGLLKPAEVVSKRLLLEKFYAFPKLSKLSNLPNNFDFSLPSLTRNFEF